MAKPTRREFEYHYVRRTLDVTERRRVIRQGYGDYQCFGWNKEPPFGMDDPKRWLWQNGAEAAEAIHAGRAHLGSIEGVPGWN